MIVRNVWQEGSDDGSDVIEGAAAGEDGSVFLAGYTSGDWTETNLGAYDYAAVKLDSNGEVVWRMQVIAYGCRYIRTTTRDA